MHVRVTGHGHQTLPGVPEHRLPPARDMPEEAGCQALRRLSWLPPELQEKVIGYLPLADVLVWQRVSRAFHRGIQTAGLRERALCRGLGAAFPVAALTRDNYDSLLDPWLAGFSTRPSSVGHVGTRLRPDLVFSGIIRTLHSARRLAFEKQASFHLEGFHDHAVTTFFSPDGRHLVVRMEPRHRCLNPGGASDYIFTWDETVGWYRGSPFVDECPLSRAPMARSTCFAPDGRRVALVRGLSEIQIWEKNKTATWQQTADLMADGQPIVFCGLNLVFCPYGRSLAVQSLYGLLYIWSLDDQQQWSSSGPFISSTLVHMQPATAFSANGCWLLMPRDNGKFLLCSRNQAGAWQQHCALETGAHRKAASATFNPVSEQLILQMQNKTLSVWQRQDDQWYEAGVVQHQDGICDFVFSPDGQHLVTRLQNWGAVLWEQGSPGQWMQKLLLGGQREYYRRMPTCAPNPTSVCFDPTGRWMMVSDCLQDLAGLEEPQMWFKRSDGCYHQQHPGGAAQLIAAYRPTPGTDGRHMAVLSCPILQDRHALNLLAFHKGVWVVRASQITPPFHYGLIAMDPFCCHLAAVCRSEPVVEFLCLREAKPPAALASTGPVAAGGSPA
ncbi:MAG: hypothetical protein OXC07_06140 [Kistimonas sp.]|nr:hypothetical protein [Kistimonas sp.]